MRLFLSVVMIFSLIPLGYLNAQDAAVGMGVGPTLGTCTCANLTSAQLKLPADEILKQAAAGADRCLETKTEERLWGSPGECLQFEPMDCNSYCIGVRDGWACSNGGTYYRWSCGTKPTSTKQLQRAYSPFTNEGREAWKVPNPAELQKFQYEQAPDALKKLLPTLAAPDLGIKLDFKPEVLDATLRPSMLEESDPVTGEKTFVLFYPGLTPDVIKEMNMIYPKSIYELPTWVKYTEYAMASVVVGTVVVVVVIAAAPVVAAAGSAIAATVVGTGSVEYATIAASAAILYVKNKDKTGKALTFKVNFKDKNYDCAKTKDGIACDKSES